jgi:hypothetical protein
MITSIEPKAGSFILLVGPRNLNGAMLTAIARLGRRSQVRVLDGGNRFHAYTVARQAYGLSSACTDPFFTTCNCQEILKRISVSRAFTCYQVLSLLESTPATSSPFIVMDMLSTFYDESVHAGERKRLLRGCLAHLHRLEAAAGGAVSVHPPAIPSQTAVELLGMLQSATPDIYFIQPSSPPSAQPALF